MVEFFKSQMDYVYFIYGMSFLILSGSTFLLFKNKRSELPWLSLTLFGFIHAINEWLDLCAISIGDNAGFKLLRVVVLTISFIFLVDFFLASSKLRYLNRWLLIPWIFVVYLGWYFTGLSGLNFTARYFLGFFGGVGVGVVLLLKSSRFSKSQRKYLRLAGVAIVLYSFTQLVIIKPPAFLADTLLNEKLFFNYLGFPIQLLRSLFISFAAFLFLNFSLFTLENLKNVTNDLRHKYRGLFFSLVYFILIIVSWLIIQGVFFYQRKVINKNFLTKVNTATGPINFKRVESLSASSLDVESLDFIRLKEELEAFNKVNDEIKYVYLLGFKDEKIVFLVDSTLPTSQDYSPPGLVYDQATQELKDRFFSGESFVAKPYTNRWGTWISAFAPIFNKETKTVVALVGLDMDIKTWQQEMFYFRLLGILASFVLFVFFISFFVINWIHDVAKQEIAVSKKELENIFDSVKAWIFYKDKKNRFIRVNQAYAKAMGMAKEELEGKSLNEIYSQEIADKFWEADKEVILSGQPKFNIVESIDTLKGRLWVQTDKFPYSDDQGNAIGIIGFAIDITERRKLEKAIWESEDRFRTMVSNVPGAIYRCKCDAYWTMDFISYAIRDISGYSSSDFIKNKVRSYESIIYFDDRRMVRDVIERASLKGEAYYIEYRIIHSDGSIRWVNERGQGVFVEGNLLWLDGVIFDFTEQKFREEKLRVLNMAVEQSPAVVAITDIKGNLTYVNPKFTEITGYCEAEVLGKNPRILKSGEQGVEFYQKLWDTVLSGRTWHGEFHNCRKDGVLYWENAYISAVKDFNGQVINFVAVKEDITERKRILHELEQKNKELQKLDTLKSEFVSVVSHELRTPLSIIKEGISLVLDGITGEINSKQSKILSTSKDNIDRLARIINNLLDISKIESGKIELNKKIIDINNLVRKVAISFELKAKEKNVEIKLNLSSGQLDLAIDEDRIVEVWVNLIGNSFKFTEKGYVQIEVIDRGQEVQCLVADTGVGVRKDDLSKLFGKFIQLDRIDGGGEKGTGLGLSIAKGLVELHGGKIWAESEFGLGTRIYFTLPK